MKLRTMLPAAAVTIGSLLLVAAPAGATTASETVTAGSLGICVDARKRYLPGYDTERPEQDRHGRAAA